MTKLCARGKAAAKRKFRVYPSAYANAYASKICAGKAKDPSGVKRKDWGPKKASLGSIISSGKGEKIYRKVLNSKLSFETDPVRRNTLIEYASVPLSGLENKVAQMRLKEKAKKPLRMQSGGSTGSGEAKVKKVISGLQKASRTHAAQAKTLQSVVKSKSGKMIKAGLGTLVKDLYSRVTGKKKSTVGSNTSTMSFQGNKLPITDLYQKAVSQKQANKGTFVQTLQPYDGSYIKGNLADHKVSNKSLTNYYKGMIDG
jgi:hypothetical protein